MSLTDAELAEIVARVRAEMREPVPTPQVVDPKHFQVVSGQVIQADHINSLADQSVPKYASYAALTAAGGWPAPPLGSLAYIQDVNALYVYDTTILGGSNAWHVIGGMRMGYGQMGANAAGVAQVIPSGTDTLLTLHTAAGAANKVGRGTWNSDGSVTVPVTGTYLVSGSITWPTNTSGDRALYARRWSTSASVWSQYGVAGGSTETNTPGTTMLRMSVSAMVMANAGEKVGLLCYQKSGVGLTLPLSVDEPRLGVHLLGAE